MKREKKTASEALKKLGYIKTSWGWLVEGRIQVAVMHELIKTNPTLGYTRKGLQNTARILNYLQGNIDSVTP